MIKIKEKIFIVNILTVISAILTIFSLSYMQGFSIVSVIAFIIAAIFAKLTYMFFSVETLLRERLILYAVRKKANKKTYYKTGAHKKFLSDVGLVG